MITRDDEELCWPPIYQAQCLNPRRHSGGGVDATPTSFCEMAPEVLGGSRWNLHNSWDILCATFGETIVTGSGQVTELWRHMSNNLRPIFHRNRIFSNITCCYWLEWKHYAWFRSEHDRIWPVTLHLDLWKVIWGYWYWPAPYLRTYLLTVTKLVVLGFLEVLRPNTWFILNIGLSPTLPSCHFPGERDFVSFRVAVHQFTNIWWRYENNMSFCSELNEEHDGECFVSVR